MVESTEKIKWKKWRTDTEEFELNIRLSEKCAFGAFEHHKSFVRDLRRHETVCVRECIDVEKFYYNRQKHVLRLI